MSSRNSRNYKPTGWNKNSCVCFVLINVVTKYRNLTNSQTPTMSLSTLGNHATATDHLQCMFTVEQDCLTFTYTSTDQTFQLVLSDFICFSAIPSMSVKTKLGETRRQERILGKKGSVTKFVTDIHTKNCHSVLPVIKLILFSQWR